MKKKHLYLLCSVALIGLCTIGGCNQKTVRTYEGPAQPLEQVSLLLTDKHTCPLYAIDSEFNCQGDLPGLEYHLLPGSHTIEFVYQTPGKVDNTWEVKKDSVVYNFEPGHVYSIRKAEIKAENAREYKNIGWAPHVEDMGTTFGYAQANPGYYKTSTDWKKFRKENGLTRRFLGVFTIAADPSEEQTQSY